MSGDIPGHSEVFASGHSERSEESHAAQGSLHEEISEIICRPDFVGIPQNDVTEQSRKFKI